MTEFVKVEMGVEMTCKSCETAVQKALSNIDGIKSFDVNLEKQQVVVETSLPTEQIIGLIETTGKRAAILGIGSQKQNVTPKGGLGAAVAMMSGTGSVQGVVRLIQLDEENCVIDGTIDGLRPGKHQLNIHEYGDLTKDCENCGDVFKMPFSTSKEREGQLGEVEANTDGRAIFRMTTQKIPVCDIIGRSMVIHDTHNSDDPKPSLRLACGIIARSSGLFENSKRICACDGITLWDEREVPLAGPSRQQNKGQGSLTSR